MSQFLMGQFSMWKRTARDLLGVAAGLGVSGTAPRSTVGLRGRRRFGDILAAVAVSSRGLGRSPLKAQTRVRIPLPLLNSNATTPRHSVTRQVRRQASNMRTAQTRW